MSFHLWGYRVYLFFYCRCNKYHKLSGLKQHRLLVLKSSVVKASIFHQAEWQAGPLFSEGFEGEFLSFFFQVFSSPYVLAVLGLRSLFFLLTFLVSRSHPHYFYHGPLPPSSKPAVVGQVKLSCLESLLLPCLPMSLPPSTSKGPCDYIGPTRSF